MQQSDQDLCPGLTQNLRGVAGLLLNRFAALVRGAGTKSCILSIVSSYGQLDVSVKVKCNCMNAIRLESSPSSNDANCLSVMLIFYGGEYRPE